MATTPLDLILRIPARHAVREAFADCSTGAPTCGGRIGYYATKGHAVHAFEEALAGCGLQFGELSGTDFTGAEGWNTLLVCNSGNCHVGYARLSWHRMESGRYEFTGYIS